MVIYVWSRGFILTTVGPPKQLVLPLPVDFWEPGFNQRLATCWRLLPPHPRQSPPRRWQCCRRAQECHSSSSALSQPVVLLLSTGSLTYLVCRQVSLFVLVWMLINRHLILHAASTSGLSSLKSLYPPTLMQSNTKRHLLCIPAPDLSSATSGVFCHLKHPFLSWKVHC